ncbi:phosphotransferase [Gordonia hydrophobica]|uniref:Phosphotransferase n=1 Tax=Gordonia hydrophobica TaxID=40516 RepID=A0ABZ2U2I9_9ACTN|nr:phosphotransferase [Gordonia hydrophobica]MBM7367810.1 tRNA A-37 threonylcarbamoyl transferase component Bud32 [Gordonia hydrophobica]
MTVIADERISSVLQTAEGVLTRRAGTSVQLDEPEDLGGTGRSSVIRARVLDNPVSLDRTVVVKAFDDQTAPSQVLREIASYRYATALPTASRPGPQLLASDFEERLLVLTDLGHGRSMVELLASTDADEVERGVSAWGQALGRMHAATLGGEEDFDTLMRVSGKTKGGSGRITVAGGGIGDAAAASVRAHDELLETIDVDAVEGSLALLERGLRLFDAGDFRDFRAFSPADVGPGNILINGDGVQFMDYEWGEFRDATLDVAYALATFPALLSADVVMERPRLELALVQAWRGEVKPLWPSINDRKLALRIFTARALWVWLSTYWMIQGDASGHDWALHTADARVVLARWADLADSGEAAGIDESFVDAADQVQEALRIYWFG